MERFVVLGSRSGAWHGATRCAEVVLTPCPRASGRRHLIARRIMERRVLLAFFLSFLVLFVYQSLVVPPPPPPSSEPVNDEAVVAAVDPTPRTNPVTAPSGDVNEQALPASIIADTAPREIVVETDAIRAVFTNRGAVLMSWELKNHLVEGDRSPIELVPRDLPADEPQPFALAFEDEVLTARAQQALFRANTTALNVTDRGETLTFDFEDETGFRVRKQFRFDRAIHPYVVVLTVDAAEGERRLIPSIRWGPALGGIESSSSGMAYRVGPRGVMYGRVEEDGFLAEPDVERPDASDVARRRTYGGQLQFVGVDNHYFLAAALPGGRETEATYRAVPLPPLTAEGDARDLMAFDLSFSEGVSDIPFFLGPKDFDVLETASPALVRAIDFGWLSWLVVPLHRSLKGVYGFVGNWGWSIIILTVLINIVISPLRHKSVVSMRKMQELQPQMKAIQERYAHLKTTHPDKQKMNQEIMALYRDRGVNPASGCLPMLLTMPILFAFYRLLSMAIEIRGAPFMLWINDLALHDPIYITPLIMGGTMVLQQRMTPTQADPTQQKIMMFMPIFFTFLFLWAPSGLVLYWLTSNVLAIGQQVITNRIIGPPRLRTVRPPAERRIKSGGTKGQGAKGRPPN